MGHLIALSTSIKIVTSVQQGKSVVSCTFVLRHVNVFCTYKVREYNCICETGASMYATVVTH